MTKSQQDPKYCFKPDCQKPKNSSDAVKCQCCGSLLLLQDRYKIVKIIGKKERTFKAIDTWKEGSQSYCAIQEHLIPANNAENVRELLAIEAEKFKEINQDRQVPNLREYFSEAGYQYVVREYIEGHRISQELAAYGAFKENEIRELLSDLLPILKILHSHGVVHGNIRPENIVRRRGDRRLVLVNFALPFIQNCSSYSPSEQIEKGANYTSDIYSLGMTCVHLLTQIEPQKLFKDKANIETWADCSVCKNLLSESLAKIIDRMIRKYPEENYYASEEILKDLRPSLDLSLYLPPKSAIAGATILAGLITARYFIAPAGQEIAKENNRSNLVNTTSFLATTNEANNPLKKAILSGNIDGNRENISLEKTAIKAKIYRNFSVTEIRQTFLNPYQQTIEAVYEFSLPDKAVINSMKIKVNERVVTGKIEKKPDAIAEFKQAKKHRQTSAILQQNKNRIYTESITNILPGEKIEISISYSKDLEFENGQYQYHFPMSIIPHHKQEKAELNKVNLTVEIDEKQIYKVKSPTHEIAIRNSNSGAKVDLKKEINSERQDFILNYRIATPEINNQKILTKTDTKGAYFVALLTPAKQYNNNKKIVPKDFVFLIDTSGSQLGYPLEQSRELLRLFIQKIHSQDRFTIIDFASNANKISDRPLNNTATNRTKALNYINNLQANGRTKLMAGIDKVLNLPAPPQGRSRAIILISDGSSNNSKEIVATAQKRLKPGNRFYTFAVGPSSDRFLINRLAEVGRGTATIVPPQAKLAQIVTNFISEIEEPVLTNVTVNWLGSGVKPEIYPPITPDIFADRPLALYGRKGDLISGKLEVIGTLASGKTYQQIIEIDFNNNNSDLLSTQILQSWGSAKVQNLTTYTRLGRNIPKIKSLTDTALKYKILSDYTAFIAVSELTQPPDISFNSDRDRGN